MTDETIISIEHYESDDPNVYKIKMRWSHGDGDAKEQILKKIVPHIRYLDKCPESYKTWLHFYQIPEKYLTLLGIQYPDWQDITGIKRVTPEEYHQGKQKSRFEIDVPLEDVVAETVWKQWQTQLNLKLGNTKVLSPEQSDRLDWIRETNVQRRCWALMEFVQEHSQEWVSVLPQRRSRFQYTLPRNYLVYAWYNWPKAFQIFKHLYELTEIADEPIKWTEENLL